MKILISTDTVGGVWHYAISLSAAFLKKQMQVVLTAMGPEPSDDQLSQLEQCEGIVFYHRKGKLEWMDEPWEDVEEAGHWLQDIARKEQPDLIHFNHFSHVALKWNCPVVLVAHSCVTSWWHAVKKECLPEKYDRYFRVVQQAFELADWVVSPTKAIGTTFSELYGRFHQMSVIYNGWEKVEEEESVQKHPIIFSMGRMWDEGKNLKLILEAAPFIDGEIYIAGDSDQTDCPPNVKFLGKLSKEEVFDWLQISQIYLLPAKYEPFGLSFLEAANYKCTLVGGHIPTLREIWGTEMVYVSPDDAEALADRCNLLLENPEQSEELGSNAAAKAKEFSVEKMVNSYLDLYQQLLPIKKAGIT
jgi:glycogen synthase